MRKGVKQRKASPKKKGKSYFHSGSNRGPIACEAIVTKRKRKRKSRGRTKGKRKGEEASKKRTGEETTEEGTNLGKPFSIVMWFASAWSRCFTSRVFTILLLVLAFACVGLTLWVCVVGSTKKNREAEEKTREWVEPVRTAKEAQQNGEWNAKKRKRKRRRSARRKGKQKGDTQSAKIGGGRGKRGRGTGRPTRGKRREAKGEEKEKGEEEKEAEERRSERGEIRRNEGGEEQRKKGKKNI